MVKNIAKIGVSGQKIFVILVDRSRMEKKSIDPFSAFNSFVVDPFYGTAFPS